MNCAQQTIASDVQYIFEVQQSYVELTRLPYIKSNLNCDSNKHTSRTCPLASRACCHDKEHYIVMKDKMTGTNCGFVVAH